MADWRILSCSIFIPQRTQSVFEWPSRILFTCKPIKLEGQFARTSDRDQSADKNHLAVRNVSWNSERASHHHRCFCGCVVLCRRLKKRAFITHKSNLRSEATLRKNKKQCATIFPLKTMQFGETSSAVLRTFCWAKATRAKSHLLDWPFS